MKLEEPWKFETEAALCHAFAQSVPPEWVVYPETAGWDMLLIHRTGGWQIGVEAKLTLNTKVILQAIEGAERRGGVTGPDFRAILVPKASAENAAIARRLGLTVVSPKPPKQWRWAKMAWGWDRVGPPMPCFSPDFPEDEKLYNIGEWWSEWGENVDWFDRFPSEREKVPEFVPEVKAGVPSPIILSEWKVKAMRACIWLNRNGTIGRPQFKALGLDMSRWREGQWLDPGPGRGQWVAGRRYIGPSLHKDHPKAWAKLEETFADWSSKLPAAPATATLSAMAAE